MRAPRQLLQQLGLQLPPATRLLVHDSTAEMRYMVLPMRPEVPALFAISLLLLLLPTPPPPLLFTCECRELRAGARRSCASW